MGNEGQAAIDPHLLLAQAVEVERIVDEAGHRLADLIHAEHPSLDYGSVLEFAKGELRAMAGDIAQFAPEVTRAR